MDTVFILLAGIALAYQCAAMAAVIAFRVRRRTDWRFTPPVSILKPVRGLDEEFDEAILSHAAQEYPEYEILFGVASLDDPAVPAIRRLIEAHPGRAIRLIHSTTPAPNGKVGVLIDLAREARHAVLLVNDSDISVPRDYLRRVVAPLRLPGCGLVTCIYRAAASSFAGRWEAFGIAADFIPSTLVAPLVGIREFGLGSTLVFRREDLAAIGGFEGIAEYIADDYQLSKRITSLGKHAYLSEVVVETHLSDPDWSAVWRHQVRWARTIRVSRGDGYAGLPVTHAGVWAAVCWLAGLPAYAVALLALRVAMALGGALALGDRRSALLSPLAPVWDLWAFAVWVAGWTGREVEWRGGRSVLSADGRLRPLEQGASEPPLPAAAPPSRQAEPKPARHDVPVR
jgi:ceramide glucosyltransferase